MIYMTCFYKVHPVVFFHSKLKLENNKYTFKILYSIICIGKIYRTNGEYIREYVYKNYFCSVRKILTLIIIFININYRVVVNSFNLITKPTSFSQILFY